MPLSWESVLLRYVDETSSWLHHVHAAHGSIRSCNGLAVLLVVTMNITCYLQKCSCVILHLLEPPRDNIRNNT